MLDIFNDLEIDLIFIRYNFNFWDKRRANTFLRGLDSINYLPGTQRLFLGDRIYLDSIYSFVYSKHLSNK